MPRRTKDLQCVMDLVSLYEVPTQELSQLLLTTSKTKSVASFFLQHAPNNRYNKQTEAYFINRTFVSRLTGAGCLLIWLLATWLRP